MNPTCWSPPIGVTTTMLDPYSSSRSSGLATRITGLDRSAARASADQPSRTTQTRARLDLLMTAAPFEVDGASVARECVAGVSERLHPSPAAAVVREKKAARTGVRPEEEGEGGDPGLLRAALGKRSNWNRHRADRGLHGA